MNELDLNSFLFGMVAGMVSSVLVTAVLRLPMQAYLAEVCCGQDRGTFWWRIIAALLLLSGSGSVIMAPAIPGWIPSSIILNPTQLLVLQLRFCWFALLCIMLTTLCIVEYFEVRRQGRRC